MMTEEVTLGGGTKAEGATFDHDYYRDKHIPLAVQWDGTFAEKYSDAVGCGANFGE